MGKRIAFYQFVNGRSLKDNFCENYSNYRKWVLTEHKRSYEEYGDKMLNESLEKFFYENQKLGNINDFSQKIIDELVLEYLLTYCDYGEGKDSIKLIGPLMSTWRYSTSNEAISKRENSTIKTLWTYLIDGRSIQNNKAYFAVDNDVLGFWKKSEMLVLLNELEYLILKTKINKTNGFEYVLSVLKEVNNNTSELIFSIEK